jgi:hypothetical protein
MFVISDVLGGESDLCIASRGGAIILTYAPYYSKEGMLNFSFESEGDWYIERWPRFQWLQPSGASITGFDLIIPDWLIFLVFIGLPGVYVIRGALRQRRRLRTPHCCLGCGYNLRGTIETNGTQCPECGKRFGVDTMVVDLD